ncbi:MAG: MATE family efflux transporter [Planctomycetota bacterium]
MAEGPILPPSSPAYRTGPASGGTAEPAEQPVLASVVTAGPVRRTLFLLALPVLAEQILNTLVGLVDTYLAGRISPAATSAVGLAAYVSWLASMLVMLIGTGTTALVSRYEGAGDHERANHFANQSLTLGAVLGLGLFIAMFTLAPAFARYCRMTGDAYSITVTYLRVGAVGYLFMSPMIVGCAALRGVGNMRTPMLIYALLNVINVVMAWSLVYGLGPFPTLGVTGIVTGTVIAQISGTLLLLAVLGHGGAGVRIRRRDLPVSWASAWRILRIGLPAAADGAVMWSGQFMFLAIISRLADPPLGEIYFATHIIAIRVEAFVYLPAMAWSAATATMIGQALGAHQPRRAMRVGHEGVLQCGLLAVAIATGFYLGARFIFEQMSTDAMVQAAGVRPFRILAMLQPFLVTSIVYVGALRGAGDTRFPLLITVVGTILIRVPVGYYFGIVEQWGLLGAWMGMFGDMLWRACASSLRYAGGAWVKTRV